MSRMFNRYLLSSLSNSELLSVVQNTDHLRYYVPSEARDLINELAERLESLDYMVQETLDRQAPGDY